MGRADRIGGILFAGLLGAAALAAGLKGHFPALAAAVLTLMALGLAYLWNRFVFRKLTVQRSLNRQFTEFDGEMTYTVTVTNRKLLPILGLRVEDSIPNGIEFADSSVLTIRKDGAGNSFRDYFQLHWYEKVRRVYEICPIKRGRFQFGPSSLHYSDPFGFFVNRKDLTQPLQLIVFPKVLPVEGIGALDTYLFGSKPQEGWIYTDPLNLVGTRPYQMTDSAQMINWKATARHAQMQVNVEKPSFDQEVYLFLDHPPEHDWWQSAIHNKLEIGIITAASLIHRYSQRGFQIQFQSNLVSRLYGLKTAPVRVDPRHGQRTQLLTNLALLQSFSVKAMEQILNRELPKIRPGSTVIVITTREGQKNQAFEHTIAKLARRCRTVLIRVGDLEMENTIKGIKEFRVDGRVGWREMETLELL